jgi:hypothetical protein
MTIFECVCTECGAELPVEVDAVGRPILWTKPCPTCVDKAYADGLADVEVQPEVVCQICGRALKFSKTGSTYEVRPCWVCK